MGIWCKGCADWKLLLSGNYYCLQVTVRRLLLQIAELLRDRKIPLITG